VCSPNTPPQHAPPNLDASVRQTAEESWLASSKVSPEGVMERWLIRQVCHFEHVQACFKLECSVVQWGAFDSLPKLKPKE
jgi:hypothetical protein